MTACFRDVSDVRLHFFELFNTDKYRKGSIEVAVSSDAEKEAEHAAKEGLGVLVELQQKGVADFVSRNA